MSMRGLALLISLAASTAALAAADTAVILANSASGSGSDVGRSANATLSCSDTAFTDIYNDYNVTDCAELSGFSFIFPNATVSVSEADAICSYSACVSVFLEIANLNISGECAIANGVYLWKDVMDPLNASSLCANAPSDSGYYSDYNSAGYILGDSGSSSNYTAGNDSSVVPSSTTGASTSSSDSMRAVTIICITVGSLLAFIVVVIAVAWYKRQSMRELRNAYADPLVEVKQRSGSAWVARDADPNASNLHDTADTTTSNERSLGPLQAVQQMQSRPLHYHGDTLWNDEELLARHMRSEDIEDIRVIGNGGHGVVYLVRHGQSRLLASKRLVQDHITREKTRLLIAEIKLVAKLEHPCIVQFVGAAWTTESDLQALFEYMPNGDLCTYLAKTSQQDEREMWDLMKVQIAMDIAEALVYVHSFSPPLVHRDLKSRNVLLAKDMRAKLTDFGVSRFHSTNHTMTTGVGTGRWLAPEVIAGGGGYDQSCDIYSLGMIITELDTHRLPFAGMRLPSGNPIPEMSILQLVTQGKLQPTFRETCPESLRAIALRCLAFDPKDRPNAIEVSWVLRTIAKKEFGM